MPLKLRRLQGARPGGPQRTVARAASVQRTVARAAGVQRTASATLTPAANRAIVERSLAFADEYIAGVAFDISSLKAVARRLSLFIGVSGAVVSALGAISSALTAIDRDAISATGLQIFAGLAVSIASAVSASMDYSGAAATRETRRAKMFRARKRLELFACAPIDTRALELQMRRVVSTIDNLREEFPPTHVPPRRVPHASRSSLSMVAPNALALIDAALLDAALLDP